MFMRTAVVNEDSEYPLIAVYITMAAQFTSFSVPAINRAVRMSGLGQTQDKRSYLKPGCTDQVIIRDVNSVRHSGVLLSVKDSRWPPTLLTQLRKGFNKY